MYMLYTPQTQDCELPISIEKGTGPLGRAQQGSTRGARIVHDLSPTFAHAMLISKVNEEQTLKQSAHRLSALATRPSRIHLRFLFSSSNAIYFASSVLHRPISLIMKMWDLA